MHYSFCTKIETNKRAILALLGHFFEGWFEALDEEEADKVFALYKQLKKRVATLSEEEAEKLVSLEGASLVDALEALL
jgi:hypothetical protein